MFFRNLTLSRFPASLDLSDLDDHLADCTLNPVGGPELSSRGFVSPFVPDAEPLSHRIHAADGLPVRARAQLTPPAVVNHLLGPTVSDNEQRTGPNTAAPATQ